MIKCISFDFDSTLAHVIPKTHILIPKLLREKGYQVTLEDFRLQCIKLRNNIPLHLQDHYRRYGTLSKEERIAFLKKYNKARVDMLELSETAEEIDKLKNWLAEEIFKQQKKILYDDVTYTIEKLAKENYKLYILSGNHSEGIQELLQEAGIFDYFEELITVDKYNQKKIANFKVLLEHSNLSAEEILHIGDDYKTDGYGPKEFGIRSIIINRPEQLFYDSRDDETFPSITELSQLFPYLQE